MTVMQDAMAIHRIELRYGALVAVMDERLRRQWAAAEAQAYGWGGVRAVSRATGLSPNTVAKGLAELEARAATSYPTDRLTGAQAGRGAETGHSS